MSAPTIPPRPSRAQNASASANSHMDVPKIPPRPKRSVDRSVSPGRDAFARSPLNDHYGHQQRDNHRLSAELPPRPPSVTLPSLGQEGSEYASMEDLSQSLSRGSDHGGSPQTKNVAGDLPLHAPKASVPSSTAKSRIQTVTRTDSSQAAAAGFGRLAPDDRNPADSSRSDSSAGNRTRPASVYKEEREDQGIPEIGVQVPMYPNAGDVQAPTPSPYEQHTSGGVGFFNKGGLPSGRHHGRTKSGREVFHGPPGSYGLHGHGVIPKDEIEQQWYAKHPDALAREKAGEYGPHIRADRKDYHWVGDDLVKLVHSPASTNVGVGTSRDAIGTPDEQIGYMATDEYLRIASPKPHSGRPASISSKSGAYVDSPLRHESGPQDEEADPEVIHIDPPTHPTSKIHGGGYDPPTEDLGPEGGNTDEKGGWVEEHGYGVPILASDEIKRRPKSEWRQPAVPPELERRASGEFTLNDPNGHPQYITKPRTHSRSSSRNNNKISRITSPPGHYDRSGTPLESTKEYEPLFPEEEDEAKKPRTVADKLKRPDLARHHFPSQDVWEDTPSSLQLETTVETPQDPEENLYEEVRDPDAGTVFEHPDTEQARISQEGQDQKSFLPKDHGKRFTNKHLGHVEGGGSGRPGMQQRFPSHDIWEDAPDHGHLVTTVSSPQVDESNDYAEGSPVAEKPHPFGKPEIPSRPQPKETSPTEKKAAPVIPERPKPSVPARPSKSPADSSEKVPTLGSQGQAPQPKAKPPVPARPAGSKIAALQAGFLKDLNNKLGLGPQAPKPKEPEPEQDKEEEAPKPLQDARKGRAKGPQRRKPASQSPAPAATITAEVAVSRPKLEFATITLIWSIGADGQLDVPAAQMAHKLQAALAPKHSEPTGKVEEQEGSTKPAAQSAVDVAKDVQEKVTSTGAQAAEVAKDVQEKVTPAATQAVEVAKDVQEKVATAGTEAAGFVNDVSQEASKSTEQEPEQLQAEIPGAFPSEEKKPVGASESVSTEKQSPEVSQSASADKRIEETPEPVSAPSPAKAELELPELPSSSQHPQSGEPVDMALMEEGKDSERRDIGL